MSIVPDAIGSLYHLKFLRLTGIRGLPSSIGNLKNLQTLYVNDGVQYCELPRETDDLINLRHLVALYLKPLEHISKLTSLQVLQNIFCDQWKDVDLVNLRELTMQNILSSYSLNNISSLTDLSTLKLICRVSDSFPSLEFVNCCEKLQKLRLDGRIEKLPLFPNSITMMVLEMSKLTKDPMPILGMLPNLRSLKLCRAYIGKKLMCSDNSFSQLEFLNLEHLWMLRRWHLGTSAMPLIKGLGIRHCPNLKEIPERMKDLKRPCLYNFIDFLKFFCTNNVLIFGLNRRRSWIISTFILLFIYWFLNVMISYCFWLFFSVWNWFEERLFMRFDAKMILW